MESRGRNALSPALAAAIAVLLPAILVIVAGCVQAPAGEQITGTAAPVQTTVTARITDAATGATPAAGDGGTGAGRSSLFLTYQPRKCEKTPWMAWEEASGRRYIRAPAEEEIIAHYYAAVYNVTVSDVEKAYLHMASCEACDVCRETFWFQLTVAKDEASPLLDDGWQPAA